MGLVEIICVFFFVACLIMWHAGWSCEQGEFLRKANCRRRPRPVADAVGTMFGAARNVNGDEYIEARWSGGGAVRVWNVAIADYFLLAIFLSAGQRDSL